MTTAELKSSFLLKYDAISNYAAPGYEDSEISQFLTDAQIKFIRNVVPLFDRTELERKVISKLVETYNTLPTDKPTYQPLPYGKSVLLPDDDHVISILMEYLIVTSRTKPVEVVPITYDRYLRSVENPFVNPDENLAWRLDIGGEHEIVTDSIYALQDYRYYARYIRKPLDVNITTGQGLEVNEGFQDSVVDLAVQLAVRTIERFRAMQQQQQAQTANKEE